MIKKYKVQIHPFHKEPSNQRPEKAEFLKTYFVLHFYEKDPNT